MKIIILLLILFSILSVNTEAAGDKTSIKSRMLKSEKMQIIIILKDQTSFKALSKEDAVSLLKNHASESQQGLAALLKEEKKRGKADKIKQFWIVNAIAVNASPELIENLAKRDDIASIELDSEFHILEDYPVQVSSSQIANATNEIKRINATRIWEFGIDGSGINVSVIDTGIDASHPDIAGRVIKWMDYVDGSVSAYDDNGHGTHVTGTMGGNGSGGTTTGVAPNVSLLIAKVCNSNGLCESSSIVNGIQWSVENNANILSLSLGGSRDEAVTAAVNNAINAGVVVVAAAGNNGPDASTIIFPAGEKNVIAAGAVDSSDIIASFSSRGPITVDGEILTKPDLSAPGVNIKSTVPSGSCTYCDASGYKLLSGTSMATPHVSGTAALLLQAARRLGTTLSPSQVKSILETSSLDLGVAGNDNTYGAGRIDVFAAVKSLDTAAPSVAANPTAYSGGNPAAKNGENITLSATITDIGFGVKNASVNVSAINASISDVLLSNVSGFWINNSVIVNTSSGIYYLNITAYDNLSNVNNSVQLSVTVDNTQPLFLNISAEPSTIEAGSESAILKANVVDMISGIARVTVNLSEIGGSSNSNMTLVNGTSLNGTWQIAVNTTTIGNFSLTVNAVDGARNFENMNILLNVTDTTPPVINSARASPDSIRANGIDYTTLTVSTHDFANVSGIRSAIVNLTQLGLGANENMNIIIDAWQLPNINTTVTNLSGSLVRLPVNVTDARNNSNISASILLGIKAPINTSVGNRTSFNFTIDSKIFNASISIPESTNLSGELLIAPVDAPALGDLKYAGAALNFSGLAFNRSLRIEIEYNSSLISGNESKLRLWFYNTTLSSWEITENSSVDTQNKTVSGNTTHFSIFAPLADTTPPDISGVTVSSITTSSATINWTTDETSQSLVKYGTSSNAYTSAKEDTSNVTSHSVQLTGLSTSTTYYYIVNSTDQRGNSADSTEMSFTTSSAEGSSGGGGGGGGGGTSGEDYANIEVKEKYDLYIFKDKVTSYIFTNKSNPILFVNITGNVNAGEINVAVEVLRNTSSLAKSPASGIVYKNINIWVGTSGFASPKNIKNAEITFRIEKEWINKNTVDSDSIVLYRYDSQWIKMPTQKIREDIEFDYYQASTEKFSPFAIAGLEGAVVPTVMPAIEVTTATPTQITNPTALQTEKAAGLKSILAITTILLAIIATMFAAVYIFERKRR